MIFFSSCLLYTSDAADDMQCVDLGGRRIEEEKRRKEEEEKKIKEQIAKEKEDGEKI